MLLIIKRFHPNYKLYMWATLSKAISCCHDSVITYFTERTKDKPNVFVVCVNVPTSKWGGGDAKCSGGILRVGKKTKETQLKLCFVLWKQHKIRKKRKEEHEPIHDVVFNLKFLPKIVIYKFKKSCFEVILTVCESKLPQFWLTIALLRIEGSSMWANTMR